MAGLIESLPEDKHELLLTSLSPLPTDPRKQKTFLGAYYTREQMRDTLKKATKKAIAELIVEPHKERLTPRQRGSILTLLEKLTC